MIGVFFTVFAFFNLFFVWALIKKDFSVIDIAWGLSYLLIFISSGYFVGDELSLREGVIGLLVMIWALRLSGYIFYRSTKTKTEDYRYAAWREEWGEKANQTAYKRVYMLQAVLSLVMASPLILIHFYSDNQSFGTVFDYIGITIWVIGFLFEAIGDYQKHVFKSREENRGKVLRTGLWQYTRHPNYFGEVLLWWGIFFLIINEVPFYFAIFGPLFTTFLILKVSGVAMLEKKYESNKEYDEYKNVTNTFFPWFPRQKRS
ncbi:MAG: DUF1295 domain-containing protein [Bacteriovoracaceae bacterium]